MKVYINDTEIEIFNGARVMDALLKYSKEDLYAVMRGDKQVTDEQQNQTLPDGELTGGQRLYVSNFNVSDTSQSPKTGREKKDE